MDIKIGDLTRENIDDLTCLCTPAWDDERHARTLKEGGVKKKEWVEKALQKFGCCAKIAYVEGKPEASSNSTQCVSSQFSRNARKEPF